MPDDASHADRLAPGSPASGFPTTRVSLLLELLSMGERGLAEARRHVMAVYAEPLGVYARSSRFRDLAEPADLVAGFFADRLSREPYLRKWVEWGGPMRLWLIGSFRNYCRERVRERARWRRLVSRGASGRDPAPADPAEGAFHRASAEAVIRSVLTRVEEACVEDGLGDHWRAFTLRRIRERTIAETAGILGVSPGRVVVMERTVAARVRASVREHVAWPGATVREVDAEIAALIEALEFKP